VDEVRDIGLVRLSGNRSSDPITVYADNWKIPGCPVNGPSIAALGETVAVVWFTMGTDGKGRVRLAVSRDGGGVFGAPMAIDDGRPLGRVDVAILTDDSVLVCWMERAKDDSEIRLHRVGADGFVWLGGEGTKGRRDEGT
jgi:hypothetical protein